MRAPLLALLLAVPGAAFPPGPSDVELAVGGRIRSFRAMVPARAPGPDGYPLLLAFHGAGGSARNMEQMTGLHVPAEAEGYVTVYARGTGPDPRRDLTWNAGRCCGYARAEGVDDVAYVRATIEAVATRIPVDRRRIHAVGFSNGAMLAYRLAAELPGTLAAIAAVGAPPDRGTRVPDPPVPVLHFHGLADSFVPYRGGLAAGPAGKLFVAPVRTTLRGLAAAYGADPRGHLEELPDLDPADGTRASRETWGAGPGGAEVVLVAIEGGTHSWPGGPEYLVELLGKASKEVDANREILAFFRRHSRGGP